ncbi:MAG: Stp1/IreP family PP2C-type Ser/Thr phosphatase [Anaerolineales bacterium]
MKYHKGQETDTLVIRDPHNKIIIRGSAVSSTGMVRGNNEDSVQLWSFETAILGLVADGMGGAAGGEEASRLAVETVQKDFLDRLPEPATWQTTTETEIFKQLRTALMKANENVLLRAEQEHELEGMGTTATLVLVQGTRALFAHIGDSRAYWIQQQSQHISRVTHDHSFVEALISSGHLTREQAEVHPMRNVLYRALGQKADSDFEVDTFAHDLAPGDRLVLCSDGLPRHLEDHEIAEIALAFSKPHMIAQSLVDLANERGGEDNVSAVVLVIEALDT